MVEGRLNICSRLWRKRGYEPDEKTTTLRRCLNRWDVTALGVGSTLGIGVYVLLGGVAIKLAGPSIILSFLIAAIIALLAGLCYAEFGARVPLAGSSYIYAYVTFGELVGFLVGWNNILEFVFGAASIAKGLSMYIDVLANHAMSDWYIEAMPLAPMLSSYFDLLAFLLVIVFGVLLAVGVRESTMVNNVLTLINVVVIIFVIIVGSVKADSLNWSIPGEQVPAGFGAGGFFPYGMWGTLKGVTICFYGFTAFDVLNSSGEEVKEPRRAIPIGILITLLVMFVSYSAASVVVTMMVPYYELAAITSVAVAFSQVGWDWAWWIVVFGSVLGISSSLFGALYPLTRLMYSMSADGLLIRWFSKVSSKKKSPIIATMVATAIIAVLSAILDLEQLVLMMCVGTLVSYTIVAVSVVLLRYQSDYVSVVKTSFWKQILGRGDKIPTRRSKFILNITMTLYIFVCICIAVVIVHTGRSIAAIVILHILALLTIIIMALQPSSKEELYFKTPLVPLLPCISIYANIHLIVLINWHTWVRVLVWLAIGIPIYFICICCYAQNANKKQTDDEIVKPYENKNGKTAAVQIVVESPTPPNTLARYNSYGDQKDDSEMNIIRADVIVPVDTNKTEQIMIQQMQIENNEEKEAKIIDLLDQVLQAEEDLYGEVISLKENKEEEATLSVDADGEGGNIPHRKSLSELSDAGSDASLGTQVLSKYDVIAQVHREDLPKVNEEEEERGNNIEDIINEDEEMTAFNESETNSRTDESGYSDTIDRQPLSDSLEDTNISNIPEPPPFDESYFSRSTPITPIGFSSIMYKPMSASLENVSVSNIPVPPPFDENLFSKITPVARSTNVSNIPVPPPFDESYFSRSTPITPIFPVANNFRKFNTISTRHSKTDLEVDDDNDNEPRVSVTSNNSQGESYMKFGSSKQLKFMSKLNDIFQKTLEKEEEEPKKRRSQSTGNAIEAELAVAESRERPQTFLDLKKELLSRDTLPSLRPVIIDEIKKPVVPAQQEDEVGEEDKTMSRQDLKSKLEIIFAIDGPQLLAKPRLMKSTSATPVDSYQTDVSSTESIPKLPKMEKNDTLKRQKEKFGLVLNSIRLNYKDDEV